MRREINFEYCDKCGDLTAKKELILQPNGYQICLNCINTLEEE